MKILIDNSNLFAGGGIQVAISFLYDLIKQGNEHEFVVVQSYKIASLVDESIFPSNFSFLHLGKIGILRKRKEMKNLENQIIPDVIFSVFGPSYHKSNFTKIVGFAIPHLLYTNSPFFKKLSFLEFLKIRLLSKIKLLAFERNSDKLIFETEDAKEIYKTKYNTTKECYVVNNTLNEVFYHPEKWIKRDLNLSGKFNLLSVTANYPHKNLQIIPEIVKILKNKFSWNDFRFVLTVNKDELGFDEETNKHIVYLGSVPIELIPNLYEQIDVVFMPTLLEVFSTSYLESMFMKKPLLASNMSFARDICGDAAIFCEAMDAECYAKSIITLRDDSKKLNDLVEKGALKVVQYGNSSDRTKKYLEIIENIKL